MTRFGVVLLFILGFFKGFAQEAKAPVMVTDLLELKTAGNITLSGNGKSFAYTVSSIITDEKNAQEHKFQSQVWVGQTAGSMPQYQFTTSSQGSGQPAWSPDGSKLAFVRAVENVPQIFLANMEGGEPVQLTNIRFGATGPVWAPDGKIIAFSVSIPLHTYINDSLLNPKRLTPPYPLEKPGMGNDFLLNAKVKPNANGTLEEVRAYLAKNEQDKKAKVIDKLNFQQEATTSGDLSINHIYTIEPVAGAKPKAITHGFSSWSNPQFVNGTPRLLLEAPLFFNYHPDRFQERAIYEMDTTGANLNILLGDSGYSYLGATVSQSGKWVAYQKIKTNYVGIGELLVKQLAGGNPIKVELDRSKSNLTWTDDDKALYFISQANGGALLQRFEVSTLKIATLTPANEGVGSFDIRGNMLLVEKYSVSMPSELYAGDADGNGLKKLTGLNSWVVGKKISLPEKHSFKNEKGMEIEYWVMKPSNYEPGKKYPLLLEIHGGPTAMWGPGERSMWHEYQFFCSKGYGVVYCNPRGSGGYGEAFMWANINDWGTGPMTDVLTALDKTAAEGWADKSKLLVTGGSYAGYLVAYILGHDRRFAAACAQRGVYDLRTFFGEGNAWRLVPNYFGGYPWDKTTATTLDRESPITYVKNIKTPLIIFHGEQDLRTGVIQSEQLYKSLKALGSPVEYVRHPGATHEITRSGNNRQRVDQMLRTWEFFERFLVK